MWIFGASFSTRPIFPRAGRAAAGSGHGWLHILSDLGIWSAYFAIPLSLGYLVLRRHDLPFRKIFVLFVAFILLCGMTHFIEAVIFWFPIYRFAGVVKLCTAVVSWFTVFAMVRAAPGILAMRSPEELEREIAARREAERRLQELNDVLERRVQERTQELTTTNISLSAERELLKTTLASIGDAVITTDLQGKVTNLNSVATALTGWTLDEAYGLPLTVVFRIINETSRQAVENPAIRALSEGVIVGLANHTLLVAKDGTERPIDDSAAPIRRPDGEVVGCVLVFRDITERKRAEEEARRRESLIQTVNDNTTELIFVKDRMNRLTYANAATLQAMGMTPQQALESEEPERFYDAAEIEQIAENDRRVLTSGEVLVVEEPYTGADGIKRVFLSTKSPLRGESGEVVGVIGVSRDITEKKRTERRLEESRASLFELIERCPFGIYIVDSDFRIATMNAGSQRGAFVNVRPVIGGPFDEAMRILWPEPVAAEIIGHFRRTLATGEPYYSRDFVNSRADIRQTEGYEWELHRITGPDGRPAVVCYYYDSTRLRQVERELRESEQRYRLVSETANDAIWDWNLATDLVVWNDGLRAFGYQPDQVGNSAAWRGEHIHGEDRRRLAGVVRDVMNGPEDSWSAEYRFRCADGSYAPVLERGRVVRENAVAVRMVGSMLDLSRQLRMENELRQIAAELSEANRKKDEFLATLAHELRNPLAPIRNGLQVLKLARFDRELIDGSREMMERQIEQMVRLVDDLMDVSRITRGKIELKKARVEIAEVVRNAVETCRPLFEQMGHQLTVTLPEHPLAVDADATRLAQVFSNLLNNSAKYSDHGGKVELTAERQNEDLVVSVRDDGIGIPADKLTSIFEMFSQVDRGLERSQGGLGIGLCLVKRLIEMHGGTIEARSDGLGQGSQFVVRLPVAQAHLGTESGVRENQAVQRSTLRILVVDDNRDGANSLAMMLRILGNEVATAYDGEEGVATAEAWRPDVILFDIGLPKLNGYEACNRLRQRDWGRQAIMIAVTGWGQDEDRRRSAEAGFDGHLIKPVDPKVLTSYLAELTKRRGTTPDAEQSR